MVTMGIATIMESRHCLLLANGAKKADAIRKMIEGPISASCPASILQMHPRVTVVLDEESAYLLTFKDHYKWIEKNKLDWQRCLLYTSPSPRDLSTSRMPSSA